MTFIKKTALFIFIIFLSVQITAAQTNWTINRNEANGDLIAVFFTSAEKGWIAGDGGYLAWTADGGRNWTRQDIGTAESINEIYFRNDDNGYLVAGKKMFVTRDGGRNWRETQIYRTGEFGKNSPEFLSIRFADKKRGIVIGSVLNAQGRVVDSLVMRTEDGGESWERIMVPSKIQDGASAHIPHPSSLIPHPSSKCPYPTKSHSGRENHARPATAIAGSMNATC